jgi:glutamate 5-kinase
LKVRPEDIKTLAIKIGTNLLSGEKAFERQVMERVVREVCRLKQAYDMNVLLVSSGAVGCGMNALGMTGRPATLPEIQAVAAVGQSTLMHHYETLFKTHGNGLRTAQVLLSLSDLDNRRNYLNVRNTLQTLFKMKNVVPVVNENDCTATEELCFGDNDTLAAKIAAKINADLLIILTDIDGLYNKNPGEHGNAVLVADVPEITPEIERMAGGAGSIAATGGMRTKIAAAKIACAAGVPVVVTNGHFENVIHGVIEGTLPRTLFLPSNTALPHRKRWIAFGRTTQGTLHVDEGARNALVNKGKSLLSAGITAVSGEFDVGDAVEIRDQRGQLLGRCLVNYSSRDIGRIRGRKSSEIESLLGRKDFDEVAHRDNMVVLEKQDL